MHEETELKLAVAPEHIDQLKRHPILRASGSKRAPTRRLVSVYYDTPAFALMRKALALRIRKDGQARIQTVKRNAVAGKSRIARGEWEGRIKGDHPDISALGDPEIRRLIEPHSNKGELKPIFTTDVQRQVWPLRIGSSEIECALDVGEIKASGRSEPLCEVELELKSGAPAKLFELARLLNKTVPLRLEPSSKAARGYNLAAGTPLRAKKAAPVHLEPEMTVHAAFISIARTCFDHIVSNVDSAHDGEDPEGIHQLRVGIRRLRAAFSVFKDAVSEPERRSLGGELRWLQRELGPAREWDVFLNDTLSAITQHYGRDGGFAVLAEAAEARRADAYERARAALTDRRYTDLLLHLEAWLDAGLGKRAPRTTTVESDSDVGARPIPEYASAVLRARQAKVHKLGCKSRKLGDEQIHKLRIRVKKLRYAAEFFRSLYGEKSTRRYIVALKDIQEVLGGAHDMFMAKALISRLEDAAGPGVEQSMGWLEGWCAAHLKNDRRRLVDSWRKFETLRPFWKEA